MRILRNPTYFKGTWIGTTGLFAYICPQCNKGLSTATGLKEHLLTHQDDADSHICPNGGKGLKLKRTMNQHIKEQHDNYGPRYCQYKCGQVCYVQKNMIDMKKVVKIIQIERPRNVVFVGRPSGTMIVSLITTS